MITKIDKYRTVLENKKLSQDDKDYISKKIKILMDEGYPQKQAIAIAYSYLDKIQKEQ